jgi:phospholipase/lecithinase/hemolysin
VAAFLAGHPTAPSSAPYTFWGGANDVYNGANPKQAADNIEAEIDALASHGAKYFLWLNVPPLGYTPRGTSAAASLNAASAAFDTEWATDVGALGALGVDVIGVNVDSLFNQILADPAAFGFTNVTTPAQGNAGADPNQYLFWDVEHPTPEADSLVAQLAYNDLTAVPEPASIGLMGASFVLIGCWLYRRRLAT